MEAKFKYYDSSVNPDHFTKEQIDRVVEGLKSDPVAVAIASDKFNESKRVRFSGLDPWDLNYETRALLWEAFDVAEANNDQEQIALVNRVMARVRAQGVELVEVCQRCGKHPICEEDKWCADCENQIEREEDGRKFWREFYEEKAIESQYQHLSRT